MASAKSRRSSIPYQSCRIARRAVILNHGADLGFETKGTLYRGAGRAVVHGDWLRKRAVEADAGHAQAPSQRVRGKFMTGSSNSRQVKDSPARARYCRASGSEANDMQVTTWYYNNARGKKKETILSRLRLSRVGRMGAHGLHIVHWIHCRSRNLIRPVPTLTQRVGGRVEDQLRTNGDGPRLVSTRRGRTPSPPSAPEPYGGGWSRVRVKLFPEDQCRYAKYDVVISDE